MLPGLYKWSTGVSISDNVNLVGTAEDTWIFQIAGNLSLAAGAIMEIQDGALAENIFWQVAGTVDLLANSRFKGILLSAQVIALEEGAAVAGSLLSQTAVTLINNRIVVPYDNTLPVEFSSFTAVAHASDYVTLNWVTESESNLYGYNVYRAENENLGTAMRINRSIIEANNQAITSSYTYKDDVVEPTTYYYWVEAAELSNENTFHGPSVVTIKDDDGEVPSLSYTQFRNFGPSPFTATTSTKLRVEDGETASITIYNLLGQLVAKEEFSAGEHTYTFSGRDINGKEVASGLYFVNMISPTASKSFKIIKMK